MQALDSVLRHLRRFVCADAAASDDAALLRQFAATGDERAFCQLVERHGPLVLSVCGRLLGQEQDAEDAFQATFLILARKAGARQWRCSVAAWLHTVARRVCRRALAVRAQQRRQERSAADRPKSEPVSESTWNQMQTILDEELERLPAKYRTPLVLCCLAGLAQDEAARQLGCSEGALRGRLQRGRELLRRRLSQRGLALGLTAPLLQGTATAAPDPALASATARAAVSFAASSGEAVATAPGHLAHGVLQNLVLVKLTWIVVILVGLAAIGGIAWGVVGATASNPLPAIPVERNDPPPERRKKAPTALAIDQQLADWKFPDIQDENHPIFHARRGVVLAVDVKQRRVLARMERTNIDAPFAIDPKAVLSFTAPWGGRSSFTQKMSLADIRKGMVLQDIERSKDGRRFVSFGCAWPILEGTVKSVDREKRTLTLEKIGLQGDQNVGVFQDQPIFSVARALTVTVEGPKQRPFLLQLEDVPPGRGVSLELELDRAIRLVALNPGWEVRGTMRSVDERKQTIRVALNVDGQVTELLLGLKPSAAIWMEGKAVALDALRKEMPILLRLDAEKRRVVGVWALAGP
jgi:RNA polymerase sigma factor (sigma-70 family)